VLYEKLGFLTTRDYLSQRKMFNDITNIRYPALIFRTEKEEKYHTCTTRDTIHFFKIIGIMTDKNVKM